MDTDKGWTDVGSTLASASQAQSCVLHPCAEGSPCFQRVHLPHPCCCAPSLQITCSYQHHLLWLSRKKSKCKGRNGSFPLTSCVQPLQPGRHWGLWVTAGKCLDTTLTWGCQGRNSVTEVTSIDEWGRRRALRRNAVSAKDATSEYHTSILANNIGEAFTPTQGRVKK